MRRTLQRRSLWVFLVGCICLLSWREESHQQGAIEQTVAAQPERVEKTLVIVVPGTWASHEHWHSIVPGMATFSSELQRGLGGFGDVYPFLWSSGNDHQSRVDAATRLAELVNDRARDFERICLVGHSHGGNICLMASAMATRPMDAVVCLGTPHPHLQARHASGESLRLPVYCSPKTLSNTKRIVCMQSESDTVPAVWSDIFKGLTENEALRLVEPWQGLKGFPRLNSDGLFFRLSGRDNLICESALEIESIENTAIPCLCHDLLGLTPHHVLHSRRMGQILGEFLRSAAPDDAMNDLRGVVLPRNSDAGEPVPQAQQEHWLAIMSDHLKLAGWRLDHADVSLDEKGRGMAGDLDNSPADIFLKLTVETDGAPVHTTSTLGNNDQPSFSLAQFFELGRTVQIAAFDRDYLRSTPLGTHVLSIGDTVPAVLEAKPDQQIHWGARLTWARCHY